MYLDSLSPRRRKQLLQLASGGCSLEPPLVSLCLLLPPGAPSPSNEAPHRPIPAGRPAPHPAVPPAATATAVDAARLRARAASLADENAGLRRSLQALTVHAKRSDAEAAALRRTAHAVEQRAAERHAAAVAALEEGQRLQQRALLDLAHTAQVQCPRILRVAGSAGYDTPLPVCSSSLRLSTLICLQGLAAENAELHSSLAASQEEAQDSSRSRASLQDRLRQLQSVCLELGAQTDSSGAPASAPAGGMGGQQAELLDRLSCTLRALGPAHASVALALRGGAAAQTCLPPPVAPGKVEAAAKGLPTDLRLALRQLEALRRERDSLAARLKAAGAAGDRLQAERRDLQQALTKERHGAAAATSELQRQLKAARDRTDSMVSGARCGLV